MTDGTQIGLLSVETRCMIHGQFPSLEASRRFTLTLQVQIALTRSRLVPHPSPTPLHGCAAAWLLETCHDQPRCADAGAQGHGRDAQALKRQIPTYLVEAVLYHLIGYRLQLIRTFCSGVVEMNISQDNPTSALYSKNKLQMPSPPINRELRTNRPSLFEFSSSWLGTADLSKEEKVVQSYLPIVPYG